MGVAKFLIVRSAIGIAWVADAPYRWYMLFTELNVRLQRRLQPTLCALWLWNSPMSVFQLFRKLPKFLSTKRTCILSFLRPQIQQSLLRLLWSCHFSNYLRYSLD